MPRIHLSGVYQQNGNSYHISGEIILQEQPFQRQKIIGRITDERGYEKDIDGLIELIENGRRLHFVTSDSQNNPEISYDLINPREEINGVYVGNWHLAKNPHRIGTAVVSLNLINSQTSQEAKQ